MPGKQRNRNINRIKDNRGEDNKINQKQNNNKSSGRKGGKSTRQEKVIMPKIEKNVSSNLFGEIQTEDKKK